jgi:hypothetical protein
MSRSHRHYPTLVVLIAAMSAAGCSMDQTLNALERVVDASASGELPPDSLFVLHPSLVAQQGAGLSVQSAPGASLSTAATDALGENLNLGDNICLRVTMDFPFTFYGVTYTRPYICPNGNISLNTTNPDATARIPLSTIAIVAPATGDWVPDASGNVYVQTVGEPGTRRYIVTWHNVRLKKQSLNGPRSTFRAILHETSNLVELHYPSLIREVRDDVQATKAGISGGPQNYIISASGVALFDLSSTSICFTPTGPSSYAETREPCPVLAPPNTAPVAVVGGPFAADEGSPILFDGTSSWDAEQDALTYAWAFGDGASSDQGFASHSYVDDGEFAVTLTVADPKGLTSEAATTAQVRNVSPAVTLAAAPGPMLAGGPTPFATILSGETAELSAVFTDPGIGDAPWRWSVDWGATIAAADEGTTEDQSAPIVVQRRVLASGTHTVTLAVEDKDGGRSTVFGTLLVNRAPIEIDVRPGTEDNFVNTSSNGRLWVAILATPTFDPSSVVVGSVRLGGASIVRKGRGTLQTMKQDADGDGDVDLWLQFETQELVKNVPLTASTTSIELFATLTNGREVAGSDAVRVTR